MHGYSIPRPWSVWPIMTLPCLIHGCMWLMASSCIFVVILKQDTYVTQKFNVVIHPRFEIHCHKISVCV